MPTAHLLKPDLSYQNKKPGHNNLDSYWKTVMAKAPKTNKAVASVTPADGFSTQLQSFPRSSGLRLLFEENIKCLYWVENHLIKSLPKMISAASDPALKKAFSTHLKLTVGHSTRLEQVFGMLDRDVLAKKSDALEGLAMDGEHTIEETLKGSPERTTGLIMAGRLVENYEITAYTGVIQLAGQLGLKDVAKILGETLAEEQEADAILSDLSKKK
jgi:ferritin-like metal-binding protein YciE